MANGPSPTVEEIQLRKRARRRLVGAITLVALMVTVLPMVLDDEPKPVGQDIAINIPSQQSTDFPLNTAKPPPPPVAQPQPAPVQMEDHAAPVAPAPVPKVTEAKPEPAALKKTEKPAEKAKEAADNPKEAKPATKVETQHGGNSYVVLLGSFLSEANAKQRQVKLKELGVKYYLEKIKSPAGEKTGVRAGPYSSRQEAEHALARLKAAGIVDGLVTEKK
ncbi:MAG: SPOR domain-containing protein [Sulfurimicrobium sp.]|nr:SPOR domain-containing protein [Sulfurimicrobium sp.]